ncbi:MAG: ABC transporter substrate-binding protein [Methylotenera sp.]|nr:ABC transporter substrate-binding protein [Methylotenera sp.]MDP1753914.1 ABC transporter substrate-binding protein [Methylotenera sp.]MDP1959318.1 ABC transporter substrate-binding protein [Methylotenera sp.]MDP3303361.1 ABC transporter substrate-binding protein [Methylotenera sp.]MDP3943958.1 ABC transporter substrate-binding protein [Methylotenera sp.]
MSFFACVLAMPACGLLIDRPIAVAAHVWPGYAPMFLAQDEGWLNAKQVRLVQTRTATASIQALINGEVDGAVLTLDEVLKVRSMGLPVSVVMVFNVSAGADMLLADASIKNLPDLKGKRIGYEPSSVGEVMLIKILQMAHLTKKEVLLVPINVDQHHQAWRNKQIDAIITYEPVATLLLTQGAHKLFDTRQAPNMVIDVLVLRKDALNFRYATSVRHLISAHFRALRHLSHNPHDAAYRMAAHLGLGVQQVLGAYKGLQLPDAANNYRLLAADKQLFLNSAHSLATLMFEHQLIKQPNDLSSLIRDEYLPRDFNVNHDE